MLTHGGWGVKRFKRLTVCHPDKRHYSQGLCRDCYMSTPAAKATRHQYYVTHKHQWIAQNARVQAEHRKLARQHGIPNTTIQAMLEAQGGRCAICGDPPKRKRLALDHDHGNGKVRAFLCHPCNGAIGLFKDDVRRLRKAIAYLKSHADRNPLRASGVAARDSRQAQSASVRRGRLPSAVWENGFGREPVDQVGHAVQKGTAEVCVPVADVSAGKTNGV